MHFLVVVWSFGTFSRGMMERGSTHHWWQSLGLELFLLLNFGSFIRVKDEWIAGDEINPPEWLRSTSSGLWTCEQSRPIGPCGLSGWCNGGGGALSGCEASALVWRVNQADRRLLSGREWEIERDPQTAPSPPSPCSPIQMGNHPVWAFFWGVDQLPTVVVVR